MSKLATRADRLKTALGERRAPLANEYKRRLRHLLTQQLTESPQLPTRQGVRRRCTLFDSTDVQDSVFQVHLVPA